MCIVDVNCAPPPSNREEVFLSGNPSTNPDAGGWKFNKGDVAGAEMPGFADSTWMGVNLPYSWNAADGGLRPTGMAANPYLGIGWFRRTYKIPADMMGKRIYIQFDESAYITDVYINGTQVGEHVGGYSRFRFDITSVAKPGMDNVIAVKVDNSAAVTASNVWIGGTNAHTPPLSGDFTLFGGIERDVRILATDNLAITPLDFGGPGVYMNWDGVSQMFTARVRLLNAGTATVNASVKVDILKEDNSVVQSFTGMQSVDPGGTMGTYHEATISGMVTSPHLWDGLADPYVYHVNITVTNVTNGNMVTDAIVQPFGFRSYKMDPSTGFSLNGKPYALRGVCMHQDHCLSVNGGFAANLNSPATCTGLAGQFSYKDSQYTDLITADFAMLKEIGNNFTRFAHYQHSDYTYSLADYTGIAAWAENAFVNRVPADCTDPTSCAEFIQNTQNQITELIRQNYNHPSIFFWSLGNEVLLKPGPSPLLVMQNLSTVAKMEDPSRTVVLAANAGTETNATDWTPQATYFNEYDGWYYRYAKDIGPWADQLHAGTAPVGVPSTVTTTPIGLSEYGAGGNPALHALPIVETGSDHTAALQSEEYESFFHETYWGVIAARPFLTLTSVWNMFDFASVFRTEGNEWGLNTKGLVTYDRSIKKDAFYLYKAVWAKVPVTYITGRRYAGLAEASTSIKVYSNQPMANLTATNNGTALPAPTSPMPGVYVWSNVPWAAGANKVTVTASSCTSCDLYGCSDTVTWNK
jgi:beta-galactosidase